MKELAIDTMTTIISKLPRERLLAASTRFPEILVRDKIVELALQFYIPTLPAS
jgi:hypothetical protein